MVVYDDPQLMVLYVSMRNAHFPTFVLKVDGTLLILARNKLIGGPNRPLFSNADLAGAPRIVARMAVGL